MVRPAMQMRGWLLRFMRVAFLGTGAWLAFHWLEPQGLGWVVPVVAAALALAWIGWRYRRLQQQRASDAAADRWAEALLDPPLRPEAIRGLRTELASLRPRGGRDAGQHARLSLVLAELLEADGDPQGALDALRSVNLPALPERTRAMVRHARAVASLSAGDVEAAAAALDAIGGATGERDVDLRVRALRGLIAVERGEAEHALELAEELRVDAGSDGDLRLEARVLKAAALDALGERADALAVMRALGEEMLGVLLVLGLPRVRRLADQALDEMD
jgi:hypothetical protein